MDKRVLARWALAFEPGRNSMGLVAQKHLRVVTGDREPLTLQELQEFLDAAHDAGIPDTATVSQPAAYQPVRYPLTFEVVWTENL